MRGTSPHSGVRILLRVGATRRRRRAIKKPPLVPAVFPTGPLGETETAGLATVAVDDNVQRQTPIDTEEQSASWVRHARTYWSTLLGRDLWHDDQAKFIWKQNKAKMPPRELQLTILWRSIGKEAAQTAHTIRRTACTDESTADDARATHRSNTARALWTLLRHADEIHSNSVVKLKQMLALPLPTGCAKQPSLPMPMPAARTATAPSCKNWLPKP